MKRLNGEIATARLDLGRESISWRKSTRVFEIFEWIDAQKSGWQVGEVADDGEIGLESEDGAAEEKNEGGGDEDEREKNKPVPMYFTHPKQLLDVFAKIDRGKFNAHKARAQDIEDQLERDTEKEQRS